ncbi:hypothetical protein OP10G_1482 [Fimbriimonas ginsengisoli Gsoil 348]|uniref:Uncharacterized protein n=1 Tax=Fimbriimonas ginsengisoli Gsoil 348 TaxID=661478 RepID=A0A068NQ12_FIMGI|nr:hypothetical protein OP10G_1482 [Fimbriimonas ginsengisoli Gsoil 348]
MKTLFVPLSLLKNQPKPYPEALLSPKVPEVNAVWRLEFLTQRSL